MKIFLDSADTVAIAHWASKKIIDGVTTNPTLLSKQGGNPTALIREIAALLPDGVISVEVTESDPELVYQQAHRIAKLAPNIRVKIPCHERYDEVIARLVADNIRLNITLVFSLLQALMMAKLNVEYISPFVGRLDDIGQDGIDLLEQIRHVYDQYGFETQILAASIRTVEHFELATLVRADAITLPVAILEKAVHHTLTDTGIKKFTDDWRAAYSGINFPE